MHRRVNKLGPIVVDGVCLSMEDEIRQGIEDFYKRLFQEGSNSGWRPSVDGLFFDILSEDEQVLLERPFSEKEVVAVLADF